MNKVVTSLVIVIVSFIFVLLVFLCQVQFSFYFLDFFFGNDDQLSKYLSVVGWLLGISILAYFIWKRIRQVSTHPRLHFSIWLTLIFCFAFPLITNRLWCFGYGTLFIGFPGLCLIYAVYFFKGISFKRLQLCLALGYGVGLLLGGIGEYQLTEYLTFKNDKYVIRMILYTVPTFMDWQVEGLVMITDKDLESTHIKNFWFGLGPCFDISVHQYQRELVLVQGRCENTGEEWLLNMCNGTFENTCCTESDEPVNIIVSVNENFEFHLNSPNEVQVE